MYAAALNKETAERRVERMNNPGGYSNDEKCVTVGMEKARKKKEREAKKAAKDDKKGAPNRAYSSKV